MLKSTTSEPTKTGESQQQWTTGAHWTTQSSASPPSSSLHSSADHTAASSPELWQVLRRQHVPHQRVPGQLQLAERAQPRGGDGRQGVGAEVPASEQRTREERDGVGVWGVDSTND